MQQHRKTGLVFIAFLLFGVCVGLVCAKPAVIVGMVTETRGHAYWQNDSKKNRLQELAELPENAKLVLAKDSKLIIVYLVSGQQYELNGPALVQFKNAKPLALSGRMPKTIGANPVLSGKTKIDPKSVQTAGQTLVSTEAKADPDFPVAVTAPPPPPPAPMPPPAVMAPSPLPSPAMTPDAIAAAQARERMEAYEAAKRSAETEMMAARQARTAESVSQIAEREAAKVAAARSAEINAVKKAAEPKPEIACPPPTSNDGTGQTEVTQCSDIED